MLLVRRSLVVDCSLRFSLGHSIVLFNLPDKRQRFIQSAEIADTITAYTSGPGKRLCAVAEKGERPSIHVFDLRTFRRKKTIQTSELQTKVNRNNVLYCKV